MRATAKNVSFRNSINLYSQKERFQKNAAKAVQQDKQVTVEEQVKTERLHSTNALLCTKPMLMPVYPVDSDTEKAVPQHHNGKKGEYKLEMALAFGGKFCSWKP